MMTRAARELRRQRWAETAWAGTPAQLAAPAGTAWRWFRAMGGWLSGARP